MQDISQKRRIAKLIKDTPPEGFTYVIRRGEPALVPAGVVRWRSRNRRRRTKARNSKPKPEPKPEPKIFNPFLPSPEPVYIDQTKKHKVWEPV